MLGELYMSRIGKKPIEIPVGVKVEKEGKTVKISGPKGTLVRALPPGVEVEIDGNYLRVKSVTENRREKAYYGLVRTLLANMVKGVTSGFEKALEISGVGYRAELKDGMLVLMLGFSAPVNYPIPPGIEIKVDKQVNITVSGIDKEQVGRVAAEIRALRKPEPYKGKGIKYVGEQIRRKAGKSVGA